MADFADLELKRFRMERIGKLTSKVIGLTENTPVKSNLMTVCTCAHPINVSISFDPFFSSQLKVDTHTTTKTWRGVYPDDK